MSDQKGSGEHNDSKSAISPKAIAEAIEILDRVARNWVKDVLNYLDKDSRDKALAIQTQLGELRFDSTEFRAVLGSIVEGKFSQTQLDSLGQMLQHTGGDVGGILLGLSDHRAFLDQRLGPQFYEELDTDVRELKENIRKQISELGASKKSKAEKSESANEILHLIERFNSNLAKLRTVLVPPKISPVKEH